MFDVASELNILSELEPLAREATETRICDRTEPTAWGRLVTVAKVLKVSETGIWLTRDINRG